MITLNNLHEEEKLTPEEKAIVEVAVMSVSRRPPRPDPVILPTQDIDVTRDARDNTGMPALMRVFRDHEGGCPMLYVDFVVQHDVDGKWRRGLVPIVDVDFAKLAQAGMRAQEEYARMVEAWNEAPPEKRESLFPSGKRVPPRDREQPSVEVPPPAPPPVKAEPPKPPVAAKPPEKKPAPPKRRGMPAIIIVRD
jgi:hypothetical protein